MQKGRIYILANAALKGLVKIGKTERSAEDRAAELSSTGVPQRYLVAYETIVNDCNAAEREIHKELSEFRYAEDREFFQMSLRDAIDRVDEICDRFFEDVPAFNDVPIPERPYVIDVNSVPPVDPASLPPIKVVAVPIAASPSRPSASAPPSVGDKQASNVPPNRKSERRPRKPSNALKGTRTLAAERCISPDFRLHGH